MRRIFNDMPRGDTWNSIHNLADIIAELNLNNDSHKCNSFNLLNHLQEYFVKAMFIIEYILHPSLQGQNCAVTAVFSDPINIKKETFSTSIAKSTTYTSEDFLQEGYIKLPALIQGLSEQSIVWYKTNHLIIIIHPLSWSDLFKIMAFKYVLIKNQDESFVLNNDLTEFYNSLIKKNSTEANNYFNNILDTEEYKTIYNKQFEKYFKIDYQEEIINTQNRVRQLRRDIDIHLRRFAEAETQINELNDQIEIYKNKPTVDHSQEVLAYISKNPYITRIVKASSESIRIYFEAPILYYDKDVVQKLQDTTDSEFKRDFYQIFLEDKYTLWTRCCLDFNTKTFNIYANEIGANKFVIGHPHIDEYRCLGNHPDEIREWIINKDFIGAITQVSAAALNLNFYDGAVISRLTYNFEEHWDDIPTFKNNETGEKVSLNQILGGTE